MMALEERAGVTIGEAAVADARTVADLDRAVREAAEAPPSGAIAFPRWARHRIVAAVRRVSQATWILPLARRFMVLRVEGRAHVEAAAGPVIFAANHQSHFDTLAILSALPRRWRSRMAVAMARDVFDPYFVPAGHARRERAMFGALYYLTVFFANAFPLPRTGPGARDTLRYAGDLASHGFSILLFPEGQRTERGEINPFQPGVAMMAARLRVPVIPVRLDGLDRVLHHTWHWPRRGPVRVAFGAPLRLEGEDYGRLARCVEDAVRALESTAAVLRTSTAA
jgi:long-chain acyl-CoA synthetase